MSPQCNDKGKKNYLIEKIHPQRFDTHEHYCPVKVDK